MNQPKWTDAELLRHEFEIAGRPDEDPTLLRARPPDNAGFRFLRAYDISPPKGTANPKSTQPFVWCALCQEATHWKGWEAEVMGDPSIRFLVGQVCARKNGGPALVAAANQFEAQRTRSEVLRAREAVLRVADHVRAGLIGWATSPGVAAVGNWRASLAQIAPAHYPALRKAAGNNPPVLLEEVEVRDHVSEQARRARGSEEPIYKTDYKPAGRVVGRALYAGAAPSGRISRMTEQFDAAIRSLRRPTDGVQTRTLKADLAELRGVADAAAELERDYAQYGRGLHDEAIDGVLAWFNKLPTQGLSVRFERRGREIVAISWEQVRSKALIPMASDIEAPIEFELLKAALLGRHAPN